MGLGLGATGDSSAAVGTGAPAGSGDPVTGLSGPPLSSLENLLGNIQNLLKVATESVRHEERQKGMIPYSSLQFSVTHRTPFEKC